MADTPVLSPNGDVHIIPEEQVPMALQNGGRVAMRMLNPQTNQAHWIPQDLAGEAMKNGGQPIGLAPQRPSDSFVQPGAGSTVGRIANAPDEVNRVLNDRDPKTNSLPTRVGKGVGRIAVGIPQMAGQVLAPPTSTEDKVTEGVGGPAALVLKRIIWDPSKQSWQHVDDLARAQQKRQGGTQTTTQKLQEAAGKTISMVPAIGPYAMNSGEQIQKTGDVAGGVAEIGAMEALPHAGEAPDVVKAGIDKVKEATSRGGEAAAPTVASTLATRASEVANNALHTIRQGADVMSTLKQARQNIMDHASDLGMAGDKAQAFVDRVMGHIQDKWEEYTLPRVGGGSQGAVPETPGVTDHIQQIASEFGAHGRGAKGRVIKPPTLSPEEKNMLDKGIQQPSPARTDFTRAMKSEESFGNNELQKTGTRGQRLGGAVATVEQWLRRIPEMGRDIQEGVDSQTMMVAKNAADKAIDSLNETPLDGQALQKFVADVNRAGGAVIGDTLDDMKAYVGDAPLKITGDTRSVLESAGNAVPALKDGIEHALDSKSWEDIAEVRRALHEFANKPGVEGLQVYKAARALDQSISDSLDGINKNLGSEYLERVKKANAISAQMGTGLLKRLVDADHASAYQYMLDMTQKQYETATSLLFDKEEGTLTEKSASYQLRIKQGMLRQIFQNSIDEKTGKLNPDMMRRELYEQNGKFGGVHDPLFKRFDTLTKGLTQLQRDVMINSTKTIPAWMGVAGKAFWIGSSALLMGMSPALAAIEVGVGLGIWLGSPAFTRWLLTPTGAEESSWFWRFSANTHATPSEIKFANRRIQIITNQIKKTESTMPKGAVGPQADARTPDSHHFSFGEWLSNNPGASHGDAWQARNKAMQAGYDITV